MSKRPIIVVHGAPEWVITFGDMMSLLLTFFILLFSISEIKQPKLFDVTQGIRTYFDLEMPATGFPLESIADVFEVMTKQPSSGESTLTAEGSDGQATESIEQPFGDNALVSKMNDSLIVEIKGRILFAEGSSELLPEGRKLCLKIRRELAGYPNRIRIVGHTSPAALPATSHYKDHDELAFAMSRAVAATLTAESDDIPEIEPSRVEIASRAARDLLPGIDLFDPVARARLSRVEVIVSPEHALKTQ